MLRCLNWLIFNFYMLALFTATNANAINTATATQPLRIAVSANFSPILKQLIPRFSKQTNIEVQIISGATGSLFQQIMHGAPFDMFLAADNLRPQALEQAHLIFANSRKTYAFGQIALYSAKNPMLSLETLIANNTNNASTSNSSQNKNTQRLAIANPKTAPYGVAAKQCLINLGMWQQLKNGLIIGNNINQTFQQIRSQAVSSGIVSYSQLVFNKLSGSLLPNDCYSPIEQQLIILKNSKNSKLAQRFSHFLLSYKVQQQLVDFGYQSAFAAPKAQLK